MWQRYSELVLVTIAVTLASGAAALLLALRPPAPSFDSRPARPIATTQAERADGQARLAPIAPSAPSPLQPAYALLRTLAHRPVWVAGAGLVAGGGVVMLMMIRRRRCRMALTGQSALMFRQAQDRATWSANARVIQGLVASGAMNARHAFARQTRHMPWWMRTRQVRAHAYATVAAFLDGQGAVGATPAEVCTSTGLSLPSVRAALRRLQHTGTVQHTGDRWVLVANDDQREVQP